MQNTSGSGTSKPVSLTKRATASVAVALTVLLGAALVPVQATSTAGRAASVVAQTVTGNGRASAAYREDGIVVKANGPGLRNWHCIDRAVGWAGPWRYTKAGAVIDCASYNSRA